MPIMLWALREARRHDVVSIHLPQFDGAAVAVAARLMRRPTVLTYHCDLRLPRGLINRLADAVVFAMNYIAGLLAHRIVAYTQDYADHSHAAAEVPAQDPHRAATGDHAGSRSRGGRRLPPAARPRSWAHRRVRLPDSRPRRASSTSSMQSTILQQEHPDIQVLFAGQYVDVVGEADYWAMLQPKIQALGDRWRFLGVLQPDEMPAFYGAIDVLVVSSVNSTESFGLVQVEAMLDGTPVVATDASRGAATRGNDRYGRGRAAVRCTCPRRRRCGGTCGWRPLPATAARDRGLVRHRRDRRMRTSSCSPSCCRGAGRKRLPTT